MFIPLHDANSLRHIRAQYVTIAIIAINVAVFLLTGFNGQQALDAINAKKTRVCGDSCKLFELVFMDFHMPVKDGVQATREIKEMVRNALIPEIPVIACTAFGARELVERWRREGMDDFLVKPLTLEKMQRVLREWRVIGGN